MNRKIVFGISLGLLFAAFGVISLLVIITRRHPYFVGAKLRLGALILSLSSAVVGCNTTSCYSPVATCYDAVMTNEFDIDQMDLQTSSIIINKAITDTITGKVYDREGNTFTYTISDSSDSIILKGNILPADGAFDDSTETFKIGFGHAIPSGQYNLRFYAEPVDSIRNNAAYRQSFSLTVTD